MPFTLLNAKTRFRRRLLDSETPFNIDAGDSGTFLNVWYNAGLQRINNDVPFIQKSATLTGQNGTKFSWDLLVAFSNFSLIRFFTITGSSGQRIIPHPRGMEYINDRESVNGIVGGTPIYYGYAAPNVTFDLIPASTPLIRLSYWATPAVLSVDEGVPEFPLNAGFDTMVLDAMALEAGPEIFGSVGEKIMAEASARYYGNPTFGNIGDIDRFRNKVYEQSNLGSDEGQIYSELGGDPAATQPRDYQGESDPWA